MILQDDIPSETDPNRIKRQKTTSVPPISNRSQPSGALPIAPASNAVHVARARPRAPSKGSAAARPAPQPCPRPPSVLPRKHASGAPPRPFAQHAATPRPTSVPSTINHRHATTGHGTPLAGRPQPPPVRHCPLASQRAGAQGAPRTRPVLTLSGLRCCVACPG